MPRHALNERTDLAESLRTAGPDVATLCGAWTTNQLAAHLVLRERSGKELLGRLPSPKLQAVAQRAIDSYVAAHPYAQLVASVAGGPPRYSPFALPLVRETVNLLEYVIHNEDVRRAAPVWEPRTLPIDRQHAIWSQLRLAARLTLRSLPFAVRLTWPSHGSMDVGRGDPRVIAAGDPVELALLAFGRQRVAAPDYEGTPGDVAAVRDATISI